MLWKVNRYSSDSVKKSNYLGCYCNLCHFETAPSEQFLTQVLQRNESISYSASSIVATTKSRDLLD